MNYQKNLKYFKKISFGGPIVMIIVGLIVSIIGFNTAGIVAVIGLLLIGGGIAIIVLLNLGRISDGQYDASVSSMLNGMKEKALNKLGVDEDEVKEIAPICFDGYVYKGATLAKKGKDGLWRTNKYESVLLFFSENEVHCYTYRFDTTVQKQTEETDVYFYKDIVSVSTASDSAQVLGQNVDYEYFKLTTAGGTTLSISLRDVEGAQRSINAMRSLLRVKKQQ